ncbi:uncharacterized protein LOC141908328 [Tubulanus polymorphus]|uniref:uncharacterized protein LOC141908328 n=1 Tax=Tubulanus polymorphus TaxID=672921 RepID=UPI003DA258FB
MESKQMDISALKVAEETVTKVNELMASLEAEDLSKKSRDLTWDVKLWITSLESRLNASKKLNAYERTECRESTVYSSGIRRERSEVRYISEVRMAPKSSIDLEARKLNQYTKSTVAASEAIRCEFGEPGDKSYTAPSISDRRLKLAPGLRTRCRIYTQNMDITRPLQVTADEISNPDKTGWLVDQGDGKRKWCVLSDMVLCVFGSQNALTTSHVLVLPTFSVNEVCFRSISREDTTGMRVLDDEGKMTVNRFHVVLTSKIDGSKRTFTASSLGDHHHWVRLLQRATALSPDPADNSDSDTSEEDLDGIDGGYEPTSSNRRSSRVELKLQTPSALELHPKPFFSKTGLVTEHRRHSHSDECDVTSATTAVTSSKKKIDPDLQMLLSRRRVSYVLATDHTDDMTKTARRKSSQISIDNSLLEHLESVAAKEHKSKSKFNLTFGRTSTNRRKTKDKPKVKLESLKSPTIKSYLRVQDLKSKYSKLWCILHEKCIYIYKSKAGNEGNIESISTVDAKVEVTDKHGFEFTITDRSSISFTLAALDRYDFNRWLKELKPDFVPDPGYVSIHQKQLPSNESPVLRISVKTDGDEQLHKPVERQPSDNRSSISSSASEPPESAILHDSGIDLPLGGVTKHGEQLETPVRPVMKIYLSSDGSDASDNEPTLSPRHRSQKKTSTESTADEIDGDALSASTPNLLGAHFGTGHFGARVEDDCPRENGNISLEGLDLEDGGSKEFDRSQEHAENARRSQDARWQQELVHLKKQQLLNELLMQKQELQKKLKVSNRLSLNPEQEVFNGRIPDDESETTIVKDITQLKQRRISTQLKVDVLNKKLKKPENKPFKLNNLLRFGATRGSSVSAPSLKEETAEEKTHIASHLKELTEELDSIEEKLCKKTENMKSIRKKSDEMSASTEALHNRKTSSSVKSRRKSQGSIGSTGSGDGGAVRLTIEHLKTAPDLRLSLSETNLRRLRDINRVSDEKPSSTPVRRRAATLGSSEAAASPMKVDSRPRSSSDFNKQKRSSSVNPETLQQIADFEEMSRSMLAGHRDAVMV